MKLPTTLIAATSLSLCTFTVLANQPPGFYRNTYPEHALPAALNAGKELMGKNAQLNAKTRALVALGVAAQIPCQYCVYVNQKRARAAGASEAEIREAVATAAHVRQWSTVLYGMNYDFETFKAEFDKIQASK